MLGLRLMVFLSLKCQPPPLWGHTRFGEQIEQSPSSKTFLPWGIDLCSLENSYNSKKIQDPGYRLAVLADNKVELLLESRQKRVTVLQIRLHPTGEVIQLLVPTLIKDIFATLRHIPVGGIVGTAFTFCACGKIKEREMTKGDYFFWQFHILHRKPYSFPQGKGNETEK